MRKKIIETIAYTSILQNGGKTHFSVSSDESPPFFTIENITTKQLSCVLSNQHLANTHEEIINNLYDLCGLSENKIINSDTLRKSLLKRNTDTSACISRSALLKRIKPLLEMGIIVAARIMKDAPSRGKSPLLYILKKPSSEAQYTLLPAPATLVQTSQTGLALETNLNANQSTKIDDFWCQLISSVLPIHDQSRIKQLTTSIPFKGGQIPISVTSLANSRIPTIRSITTIIALLTVVEQIIKQKVKTGEPVTQQYCIELSQLIKVKRQKNGGINRATALQHLLEWNNTQFTFDELPADVINSINNKFGFTDYGFSTHQLISQLSAVGELRNNQKHPSFIQFELPLDLVKRINTDGVYNLFTVTPSIMKENTPLAIAIHLYCRKKLGHKTHLLTPNIKTLWKEVAASMIFKDFVKAFKNLLEERKIKIRDLPEEDIHIKQAKILGYLITLNKEQVIINVDGEDKYVGTMSTHKRLMAKDAREQSSRLKTK